MLKPGDSIHLRGKLVSDTEKLYSVNADSLNLYCNQKLKYGIAQKSWIKKYFSRVDRVKKTCSIKIN
jgi:hypothetical protein